MLAAGAIGPNGRGDAVDGAAATGASVRETAVGMWRWWRDMVNPALCSIAWWCGRIALNRVDWWYKAAQRQSEGGKRARNRGLWWYSRGRRQRLDRAWTFGYLGRLRSRRTVARSG